MVLTARDILKRCSAAYNGLTSLEAAGYLRDYRDASRHVKLIQWDLMRPTSGRIQIEMNLAVVNAGSHWTYDAKTNRFASHQDTTTIQSAASQVSNGIPFLLPVLWEKSERVFELSGPQGGSRWRLGGLDWHADWPCYRMVRDGTWQQQPARITAWIDQDDFLIRGWAIERASADPADQLICGCSYFVVRPNKSMPANGFQIAPPRPIVLPRRRLEPTPRDF